MGPCVQMKPSQHLEGRPRFHGTRLIGVGWFDGKTVRISARFGMDRGHKVTVTPTRFSYQAYNGIANDRLFERHRWVLEAFIHSDLRTQV